MFVLRHKKLPYYITWELDDETFDFYKDQINMEMKENGLDSFSVSVVNGNQYTGIKVEEPKARKRSVKNDAKPVKDTEIKEIVKAEVEIPPMPPKKKSVEKTDESGKVPVEKSKGIPDISRGTRKVKKQKPEKMKGPRKGPRTEVGEREVVRPTRKLFNKKTQTEEQS